MEKATETTLVIGASGQLGKAITGLLDQYNHPTVAFVRPTSKLDTSSFTSVKLAQGDLADAASLRSACAGVASVIATASTIVPGRNDTFATNDVQHYRNLISACKENQVQHLVYISAFPSPYDDKVPEFKIKRQIEQLIIDSGIPYTIFRGAAFMDIYFAVMGSRIVLDGVSQPTLLRGYWLTSLYAKLTGGLLENHGIAILPGNGNARHAFISIRDVAQFMVSALNTPTAKNRIIDLGGPEAISWRGVAAAYSKQMGRKVRTIPMPLWVYRALKSILNTTSPAGSNIMALLELLGHYSFTPDMAALSREFNVQMQDTQAFLKDKFENNK